MDALFANMSGGSVGVIIFVGIGLLVLLTKRNGNNRNGNGPNGGNNGGGYNNGGGWNNRNNGGGWGGGW